MQIQWHNYVVIIAVYHVIVRTWLYVIDLLIITDDF